MPIMNNASTKRTIRFPNIHIIHDYIDASLTVFMDYKCKIDDSGNNITKQLSKQYPLPLHTLTTVHSSCIWKNETACFLLLYNRTNYFWCNNIYTH